MSIRDERQFHLGDILTILTGRLVSPRHVKGVYDILNYMTGDNLFTHQLPRASRECEPYLREQFPHLASAAMDIQTAKLAHAMEPEMDNAQRQAIVDEWLAEQVAIYGTMHAVRPIRPEDHCVIDPVQELMDRVGAERVIVLTP